MNIFYDIWLSRYLRPEYIGFDNGGEYKIVFEELPPDTPDNLERIIGIIE
jgi:hypothetical protein